MTKEIPNSPLLELAPSELTIPLKVTHAGRTYRVTHHLRPPAPADWFAYEAALQMAVEELPPDPHSDEPRFRLLMRSADAALELWDRLALAVTGYSLPGAQQDSHSLWDGALAPSESEMARSATTEGVRGKLPRVPPLSNCRLEEEPNWRALIPLAHKEAAVRALTLVAPAQLQVESDDPGSTSDQSTNQPLNQSTDNYFPLHAEQVPVVLEAAVAGRAYPRLVHLFRPPTVADERSYRRLLAETLIVRGGRHPRTLIPTRLPALCRLYDSLILAAEGYSVQDQPLVSSLHAIQSMDPWHKRVAVQALFGDANDSSPATGPSADVGSEELVEP